MRALATCALAVLSFHAFEAAACGCFATSTTVADPVVQAGERILFVQDGNQVTATVQIRFQGEAENFGWLLPVPAVPNVDVGTDELFEVLDANTTPRFLLNTSLDPACRPRSTFVGCGGAVPLSARGAPEGEDAGTGHSPLVLRDTAGPYEYAVLKADSQAELQSWLNVNRFFVPVTSDAALRPYIRPGAYFLALKLRSGQRTGDLRPVVLKYTSDYPMIPLILTSATSVPNMGVQVFVLGSGRAVPRNYHHVELNLLKLDWQTAENYVALVTAAVAEAPQKQAFVTEYAGPADVARRQLTNGSRFGSRSELASLGTPESFVQHLYANGFTVRGTQDLSEALMNVLETQIPYDARRGVSRQEFYRNLAAHLDRSTSRYDGPALADVVWKTVAQPILDAEALLHSKPKLTRLFTTLSPEDMTKDPVFAINSALPDVAAERSAARVTGCTGVPTTFSASGYLVADESLLTAEKKAQLPAAARIEQLFEEGPPVKVSSYTLDEELASAMRSMGARCASVDGALFAALGGAWLFFRRRKFDGR